MTIEIEEIDTLGSSLLNLPPEKQKEARRILLKKVIERAREDFYTFVLLIAPHCLPEEFKSGRHIELICAELQKIEKYVEATRKTGTQGNAGKDSGKVQIFLPPGSMKSILGSRLFSAWCLGRHPKWRILAVGHSRDFAIDNVGRPVRDLIASSEYQEIFPGITLNEDILSAGRWETLQGGQFYAAGAGTRIAGRRSHIAIVDDVISEQEADSKQKRTVINRWYGRGLQSRLLPGAAEVVINCLVGDSPVLMGDGSWKSIKDMKVGDEVLSHNTLFGCYEKKRVYAVIPQGTAEVYEVKTKNSTVIATDRHPFLVEEGDGRLAYVPVKDLKIGEKILYSLNKFYDEDCDPARVTEKEAWLLGFMLGDGWTNNSKRRSGKQKGASRYVTCVAESIYPDLNKKVVDTFQDLFGIPLKNTKFGYKRTDIKRVCEWLRNHGIVGNAHTKRIQTWMFRQPETVRKAFLAGFVDADGHIDKKNTVVVGLCNKELIKDLKIFAEGLGHKVSNVYTQKSFHKPPNSKEAREWIQYRIQWGSTVYQEEFITTKVVSITKLPEKQEVWDISVEDNENFIVNSITSHNTRWHVEDLSGYTIKKAEKTRRPFRIVSVPALLNQKAADYLRREGDPPELYAVGTSFWPEFWPTAELLDKRDGGTLTPGDWAALYMQNPVPDEGNIIKSTDFQHWELEYPPDCEYLLLSLDTAFSSKQTADYSAYTLWGIFHKREEFSNGTSGNVANMILLAGGKGHWEFPELCTNVTRLYKKYKPDSIIIEKKASGQSLLQEFRHRGYPVAEYIPDRDKMSRVHASTPFFQNKRVWIPNKSWVNEIVEEIISFPHAPNDDYVDTVTQAVLWMRDNWQLHHQGYKSFFEADDEPKSPKKRATYWSVTANKLR